MTYLEELKEELEKEESTLRQIVADQEEIKKQIDSLKEKRVALTEKEQKIKGYIYALGLDIEDEIICPSKRSWFEDK